MKNLMSYSKEIMDKVSILLKQNKSPLCTMSDNDIDELCNNSCTLLILWDGAMAVLHTEFPGEEDCDKAQQFIDAALKLTRKMSMTVTPKSHGGEAHLVKQMRATKGGLFEHDESWGEQYHLGHHFDMRLRNQGSEVRKARVRAAEVRRVGLVGTQLAMQELKNDKKGKRKGTILKEEEHKKVKKERRENALNNSN